MLLGGRRGGEWEEEERPSIWSAEEEREGEARILSCREIMDSLVSGKEGEERGGETLFSMWLDRRGDKEEWSSTWGVEEETESSWVEEERKEEREEERALWASCTVLSCGGDKEERGAEQTRSLVAGRGTEEEDEENDEDEEESASMMSSKMKRDDFGIGRGWLSLNSFVSLERAFNNTSDTISLMSSLLLSLFGRECPCSL